MKTNFLFSLLLVCLFSLVSKAQTPVEKYGRLRVQGNRIVDSLGNPVQLKGMSLFWSQWIGKYYTENTVKWLKDDWCISVIRAAMAADSSDGGYARSAALAQQQTNRVITVVDAAIKLGIYVIIDFHSHKAHYDVNRAAARSFFSQMSKRYSGVPNVIYETWNEPLNPSWADSIKPYHEEIIDTIRANDPNSLIVCGTRTWSQRVDEAAADPINRPNIAYTLHYYANTHKATLRSLARTALNNGIALFVTEYGTCNASGNGGFNAAESATWWQFLDDNKISYCNWSVADKVETASVLKPNASTSGNWAETDLTESGILVRNNLLASCQFPTSLSDKDINQVNATCFPNPFASSFTIQSPGTFEYVLRDAYGNVQAQGTGTEAVTVNKEVAAGMYIVQISYKSSSKFVKLTKN